MPTYRISAQVPNADALVPGNEVRIGGVRVGVVESIEPVAGRATATSARRARPEARQERRPAADRLDRDRPRATRRSGSSTCEINPGDSDEGYRRGRDDPALGRAPGAGRDRPGSSTRSTSRPGRRSSRTWSSSATRSPAAGRDLNAAIGELPSRCSTRLEPVMREPRVAPSTDLGRLLPRARGDLAAEVAPVAETQAQLFVALDTHLRRLRRRSRAPSSRRRSPRTPPTLDAATDDAAARSARSSATARRCSPTSQPGAKALGRDLADDRRGAARRASRCCAARRRSTTSSPPTAARAAAPSTTTPASATALDRLDRHSTSRSARRSSFIAPAQTVCNYATLLFRNLDERPRAGQRPRHAGSGSPSSSRPTGPNSEGSSASAPANGGSSDPDNYLHSNPYPNTAAPGQTFECEAGNEPYAVGQHGDRQPARQPGHRRPQDQPRASCTEAAVMRRAAKRDTGASPAPDERHLRPPLPRPERRAIVGLIVVILIVDRLLPRLHQAASRSPAPATSSTRPSRTRRPCARPRRCGSPASTSARSPTSSATATTAKVTFTVDDDGPADPRRRRRSRSARASSSRATSSSTSQPGSPSAPELDERRHDPGHPDLDRGPARRGPDRAAGADRARTCSRLLEGYGTALNHQPTAADDAHPGPRRRRARARREALNEALQVRRRGRPRAPRSSTRPCSASSPHDLSGLIARQPRRVRELASREERPQRPDHQLQHLHRRARRRVGEPVGHDRRAGADARGRRSPRCANLNDALPPLRACAIELTPGRPGAARHDRRRRRRGSTRPRPLLQASELGGLARAAARRRRRASPRSTAGAQGAVRRSSTALSRCIDQGPGPDRRHDDHRRRPSSAPASRTSASSSTALANLAGAGQGFDGNGPYLRVQAGGGPVLGADAATRPATPDDTRSTSRNTIAAAARHPAAARRPAAPPFRTDVPCYKNPVPDLNGPPAPSRPAGPATPVPRETRDPRTPARLHRDRRPARARRSSTTGS